MLRVETAPLCDRGTECSRPTRWILGADPRKERVRDGHGPQGSSSAERSPSSAHREKWPTPYRHLSDVRHPIERAIARVGPPSRTSPTGTRTVAYSVGYLPPP